MFAPALAQCWCRLAEFRSFDMALGNCDAIVISEGPNDDVAARLALAIGAQGNVRTDTMRVFNEAEFRKLVSGLP